MDTLPGRLREEKEMKLTGGIYHLTQIKLCYNSNRIEGSRLTEDQTRYIFETNTICTGGKETADVDDIIETKNHFACFDYMLDNADLPLSEEIIKGIHKILKNATTDSTREWFRAGDYKARPNMVGDTETTPPRKVKSAMKGLLQEYNQKDRAGFEDIIRFHYRFERIHPFQDGNGRVGRLILFKECIKNGITPFVIDEKHKQFYYRGLREFDHTPGYLLDTCLSAQDTYKEYLTLFEIREGKPGIRTDRKGQVQKRSSK
ncbi:MAG: Fic family protein [Treponema sp.]|nr:Fic family protein [Treponema sp.]